MKNLYESEYDDQRLTLCLNLSTHVPGLELVF